MNSQIAPQSRLPFGIDLDDDVTVKLWSNGSITCIKYGGVGEQDEVPISKEGVAKLVAWLNKHATQHTLAPDACPVCHLAHSPNGVEGCGNSSCPSRAGKA